MSILNIEFLLLETFGHENCFLYWLVGGGGKATTILYEHLKNRLSIMNMSEMPNSRNF